MSEFLRPANKVKAALLAASISGVALVGCGGNDTEKVVMTVGVECPENTSVDIEKIDNPRYNYDDSATINVSCDGEQPLAIQILNDGKTETITNTDNLTKIEIAADYWGGTFGSNGEDPRISADIQPEDGVSQIIINDIDYVTKAQVIG